MKKEKTKEPNMAPDSDDVAARERKRAADVTRYEALAREHGADLSEEGFNEALKKMGRSKSG